MAKKIAMTTIQIRIDSKTKKAAQKIFDDLGLDLSSGIKAFLRQAVIKKGLPLDQMVTENGLTVAQEQEILEATRKGDTIGPMTGEEALAYLDRIIKKNGDSIR